MRKYLNLIALTGFLVVAGLTSSLYAQCTVGTQGQYPFATIVPACIGTPELIVNCAFTDEYSRITLTAGVSYTFTSDIPTDFFTITDVATNTPQISGVGPLVFVCGVTGDYFLYRNVSAACDADVFVCRDISVQCGTPPPPIVNDACATAIPVNCGDVISGSTVTATPDPTAPFCGSNTSNGVWYSFVGNGLTWTVSLCGSAYDTRLGIYTGADCSTLTCLSSNDDFCGAGSQLVVPTTPGTNYFVLVNGFGTANGNYTLTVTTPPIANDVCLNAAAVTPGTVSGSTQCAGVDAVPAAGSATAPTAGGVWYTYTTACSGNITASLCTGTSFNSQISVFSGTCGALVAVDGNDDFCSTQSQVTFAGTGGTTYYILVHGNGTAEGTFDLTLSQVDATAPVPNVLSLPPINSTCGVTLTPPTATDNCAGALTGSTAILDFVLNGTYNVTWTYDDLNGNTTTQTQSVTVNDIVAPTITCATNVTVSNDVDSCGAVVDYTVTGLDDCSVAYTGTDNYYIRSNTTGEPWGSSNNVTAMDAVFGAGNWNSQFFETCTPATVFSSATKFVFLEGSDDHANELSSFLAINMSLIETYVNNGGTIFINAAPNEGANINVGFGGTSIDYNYPVTACASVTAVNVADPVFNGPFLPCGTAFTGGDFAHSSISGSGLTNIIQGCGQFQVASKTWGSGLATFGGMTVPQFHSPLPNAQNLRQNIISMVATTVTSGGMPVITQTAGLPAGSYFPTGTTTNTFLADDGNGNTSTCTFTVTVNDDQAPTPDADSSAAFSFGSGPIAVLCPDATTTLDSILVSGAPLSLNSGDLSSVCINIPHTWVSDLTINLISPLGTIFTLTDGNGGSGDNYTNTCFDMSAATNINSGTPPFTGSFIPEGAGGFDSFNGEDPNGYWKISIFDAFFGDQGTLTNFDINFNFQYPTLLEEAHVECSITGPTAVDNCDGALTATTSDPTSFTVDGTYSVNWTYTDAAGNTATQSQTVIVDDVTAPVPDAASLPIVSNPCTATVSGVPTATDNCMGSITGTTTDALTYNVAGTYTVEWTYDDGRGNITTQTQTVIVTDNAPPVPNVAILPNVTGNCVVTIDSPPTATDGCSGTIVGTTTDPVSYNLIGTFLVIWTFDDGNGNTWTQNQIVVVDPCLGLEDEAGNWNAMVYPNPGSGIFTLTLSQIPTSNTEIRLVDALGQVLYAGTLTEQSKQFDFSNLASATYYLLINNNEGQISKPVIIRHND